MFYFLLFVFPSVCVCSLSPSRLHAVKLPDTIQIIVFIPLPVVVFTLTYTWVSFLSSCNDLSPVKRRRTGSEARKRQKLAYHESQRRRQQQSHEDAKRGIAKTRRYALVKPVGTACMHIVQAASLVLTRDFRAEVYVHSSCALVRV